MRTDIKKESINIKSALILAILSVILSLVSAVFGPMGLYISLLPMAASAGLLAALIHFECEKNNLIRIIAPILIVVIDWIFNGFYSLSGILIVVSALMIFLVYEQGWAKFESSMAMSLIAAGIIALIFIVAGIKNDQGLPVREFYQNFYENFKSEYLNYYNQVYVPMYEEMGVEPISAENIIYALDYMVGMLVSILFIAGFALVGVATKVYSFILEKLGTNKEKLRGWRFSPSSIFAYFYAILGLFSMFLSTELTTFNLSIFNLETIFMVVFWYMGIIAIGKLIRERKKRGLPILLTTVCAAFITLFFSRIVSYAGVFYCIVTNKMKKMKDENID
jgi:hypothetical protein